ncbi:MAG: dihydroorotase [Planctomycetales bacterium]|nr:dihydroorotase [Planctomycetales bacterium]
MAKRVLIRGAQVVLPDGIALTNVLLQDDKILAVDAGWDQSCQEIVEATGHYLLPGVIDDQVHFREPGAEHKEDLESGSRACAAGGVTTFLEMPNTSPPAVDHERLAWKYLRAAKVSRVNYGFYIGATDSNLDALRAATQLKGVEPQGKSICVPGIKIFIGSSTGDLLVDSQGALEEIFSSTQLPICAHCEDESTVRANRAMVGENPTIQDHSRIRDTRAATVATSRAVDLALRHKHRFHVLHASAEDELSLIRAGKPFVTAEACPHHFLFSIDDYARLGTLCQMNPALKSRQDAVAIWNALVDGTIQLIATDHAPHTIQEKQLTYPASPSGIPAVENCLPLMLNRANQGLCTLEQIAGWMSDAPARVWGLVGKGRIEAGYDADLVLVDMGLKRTVDNNVQFTRCGWSPWAGEVLQGWPIRTWVGGQTVFCQNQLLESVRGRAVLCDHSRGGYWSLTSGVGLR